MINLLLYWINDKERQEKIIFIKKYQFRKGRTLFKFTFFKINGVLQVDFEQCVRRLAQYPADKWKKNSSQGWAGYCEVLEIESEFM